MCLHRVQLESREIHQQQIVDLGESRAEPANGSFDRLASTLYEEPFAPSFVSLFSGKPRALVGNSFLASNTHGYKTSTESTFTSSSVRQMSCVSKLDQTATHSWVYYVLVSLVEREFDNDFET